jgi:lectin-like protein
LTDGRLPQKVERGIVAVDRGFAGASGLMLHSSSLRHQRRAHRRWLASLVACRAWPALAVAAFGCLPERALSSYMSEGDGDSSPPILAPGPGVDAGGDASADAGARLDASVGATPMDAAPPRALACREECVCEPRDGRDFMFCATLVSFAVGAERCAAAGGSLVSVEGPSLNDWLTQRMQAVAVDDFWLSGTDAATEGVWRWADGTIFFDLTSDAGARGFAPWDAQQPNDLNGEDCMRSTAGVWRDLECADALAYACEG